MIPYFEQPTLALGPLKIHAFGVLVATAVLLGTSLLLKRVKAFGGDVEATQRLATWIVVGGFITAHMVDRFVYFPQRTFADPLSIVRIWDGISSFGGFLGAAIAIQLFRRKHRLEPVMLYIDAVAYALPFAWIFGRTGCFVAFDHPGSPTTLFIGQMYSDGVVRHNLGLEEALYTLLIAATMWLLGRKPRPAGFFIGVLIMIYAPFRFGLDFLRKIDVRYLGLTPGQFGAIAIFLLGLWILVRAQRSGLAPATATKP